MCEPHHSIIQFPSDDQGDSRLDMTLGTLAQWKKKIRGFFNLSKFGKGHSECLESIRNTSNVGAHVSFMLPNKMDYEVAWWERNIKADNCQPSKEALLSAIDYANLTSIGDIGMLRRFLEKSMIETERFRVYPHCFRMMLNKQGQLQFDRDFKKVRGSKKSRINFMMGYTRKRRLLVPEWAE